MANGRWPCPMLWPRKKKPSCSPERVLHPAPLQARVLDELKAVLTSDDAPNAVRALINDAGTYDVATDTGGFNGSIRLE